MQAIILLGGQGTRLRSLYADRPKALVPVAGRPFIKWQIDWLQRGGLTSFHLAAGHQAEQIEDWAADRPAVTVSREPRPLGTGGALRFAAPHLQTDPFWVINGDTLLPDLSFQGLEDSFPAASKDWKAVLAVTRIPDAGRFGTVQFDASHRITAFREKQDEAEGWINGGVYCMRRSVLDRIPPDLPFSLERDLFPLLAEERALFAYPANPPLLDMGTPDGLRTMADYLFNE